MEKFLNKLLYGNQTPIMQPKSKSNTILARFEKVQRLRSIATKERTYCKVYQANRLLKDLTAQLNDINQFQVLNAN